MISRHPYHVHSPDLRRKSKSPRRNNPGVRDDIEVHADTLGSRQILSPMLNTSDARCAKGANTNAMIVRVFTVLASRKTAEPLSEPGCLP
jgi:hypothetical protein